MVALVTPAVRSESVVRWCRHWHSLITERKSNSTAQHSTARKQRNSSTSRCSRHRAHHTSPARPPRYYTEGTGCSGSVHRHFPNVSAAAGCAARSSAKLAPPMPSCCAFIESSTQTFNRGKSLCDARIGQAGAVCGGSLPCGFSMPPPRYSP